MTITKRAACCLAAAGFVVAFTPFDIHAAAATSVTLTPAQTRALFGDHIIFQYFNGTDYVTDSFDYQNPNTVPTSLYEMGRGSRDIWDALNGSTSRYVLYRTTTTVPTQQEPYYTVRITPSVNLSGITDCDFMIGISTPCTYTNGELDIVSTQRTNSTVWGGTYKVNGDYEFLRSFSYSASPTVALDYWAWQEFQAGAWKQPFLLTALRMHKSSYSLLTDIDVMRTGPVTRNELDSGNTYLIIQCPTLSDTYSNDPNYIPSTDLTGTNLKLDNIISILNMIANNTAETNDQLDGISDQLDAISSQIANQGTPSSDPGNSDNQVESDANEFDDTMDDINEQMDFLDSFDEDIDNINFEAAQYTQMFSDVHDLIVDDPSDRQIVPDVGTTPGTLPNAMAEITGSLNGQPSILKTIMSVTAMIALISFVIFGKWCT